MGWIGLHSYLSLSRCLFVVCRVKLPESVVLRTACGVMDRGCKRDRLTQITGARVPSINVEWHSHVFAHQVPANESSWKLP